jgi:hypothetical protein
MNISVPGFQKIRMKRRLKIMYTFSKKGIMVNKNQRGMNVEEVHLQEDPKHQISFMHYEGNTIREYRDQLRHEFKRTKSQRELVAPRYQCLFLSYCFTCNKFGHKVVDCRSYGRNFQARNVYVPP